MFEDGLASGRSDVQFYNGQNKKNKVVTVDEIKKYADANGYIVDDFHTKNVDRFGDKAQSVSHFKFLPKTEFPAFLYSRATTNASISYEQLTKQATACIYDNGIFKKVTAKWSGDVNNGLAEGKGAGFVYDETSDVYYAFSGTFSNGLPQGELKTATGSISGCTSSALSLSYNGKITVGMFSGGFADFIAEGNDLYGFINDKGEMAIKPSYKSVVKKFSNGIAEVKDSEDKEIQIDRTGKMLAYTQHQKQLDLKAKQEQERKALEEKRAAERKSLEEKRKAEETARYARQEAERREERIRNAREGDIIRYTYSTSELFGFFVYQITISCYIEKNVDNGARMQVRIAEIENESSRDPEINGMKVRRGDVIWIKPLYESHWNM